jgi:hypothetical protein
MIPSHNSRLRVLLDAHIDKLLKKSIPEHDVWTARNVRLEHLSDGDLLNVIDGRFDVLITMDRSIQFQNKLSGRSFGVILLRAKSNTIKDLRAGTANSDGEMSGVSA